MPLKTHLYVNVFGADDLEMTARALGTANSSYVVRIGSLNLYCDEAERGDFAQRLRNLADIIDALGTPDEAVAAAKTVTK